MATAVGLRSVVFKHWTGSLLELDSTRYEAQDENQYFTESDERNEQCWKRIPTDISQLAWASRAKGFCSLSELNPANAGSLDTIQMNVSNWSTTDMSGSQHDANNSIAPLSFEQLLGLSQLLKFIHGRSPSRVSSHHSGTNMDTDYRNSHPDGENHVSGWKRCLTGQALLNNQTSSLTNLPNSVRTHPSLPIDLQDPISLILNRPKRRHYNSESELFLPENSQYNVSNNLQNTTTQNGEESIELVENPDSQSNQSVTSQNETTNDSCLPLDEPHPASPIDRISDHGFDEITPTTSPDLESQNCTLAEATNPVDLLDKSASHGAEHAKSSENPLNELSSTIELLDQVFKCTEDNHCQSTLTSKSSKGSLKISKSVSFADEIGQCLTETFVFDDNEDSQFTLPEYEDFFEDPMFEPCFKLKVIKSNNQNRFTRSRTKRTFTDPLFANFTTSYKVPEQISSTPDFTQNQSVNLEAQPMWNMAFSQPASQYYEFRHRLENNSVSLESVSLTQPGETDDKDHVKISGTIKVKNISFEKQVWLRVSVDNWKSHVDYPANYNLELSTGTWSSPSRFDTFVFQVTLDLSKIQIAPDHKIEFAIRYQAGLNGALGEYWDSNNGRNYVIQQKMIRPVWTHSTNSTAQNSKPHEYAQTHHQPQQSLNPYTLDYRPNFDGFSSFTDYRAWRHFAGETSYY